MSANPIDNVIVQELKKEVKQLRALRNAVKELYPFLHDESMEGETDFEKAWLEVERLLKESER